MNKFLFFYLASALSLLAQSSAVQVNSSNVLIHPSSTNFYTANPPPSSSSTITLTGSVTGSGTNTISTTVVNVPWSTLTGSLTAGGDLQGMYPNPSVNKVQGVLPAAGAANALGVVPNASGGFVTSNNGTLSGTTILSGTSIFSGLIGSHLYFVGSDLQIDPEDEGSSFPVLSGNNWSIHGDGSAQFGAPGFYVNSTGTIISPIISGTTLINGSVGGTGTNGTSGILLQTNGDATNLTYQSTSINDIGVFLSGGMIGDSEIPINSLTDIYNGNADISISQLELNGTSMTGVNTNLSQTLLSTDGDASGCIVSGSLLSNLFDGSSGYVANSAALMGVSFDASVLDAASVPVNTNGGFPVLTGGGSLPLGGASVLFFNSNIMDGLLVSYGSINSLDWQNRLAIDSTGGTTVFSWASVAAFGASVKASLTGTNSLITVQTGTLVGGTSTKIVPAGCHPWVQDNAASLTNVGSLVVTVSGTIATITSTNVLDTSPFSLFNYGNQ